MRQNLKQFQIVFDARSFHLQNPPQSAFYCKDIITGSRTSLETKNRAEAERLILHKNEAMRHPLLNRKIGMAYLAGTDSAITKRTWQDVMEDIIKDKQDPTLRRWRISPPPLCALGGVLRACLKKNLGMFG